MHADCPPVRPSPQVAPNLVEHLESMLVSVRRVTVTTRGIPLADLRVQAPRSEEITTVESSMRLDAVARCARGGGLG
jgi:RNA-binding protein YlmH